MSCNCQNKCSCGSHGVELLKAQNGADAPAIIAVNVNPNNTLKFTFTDGSILNTQTPIQFNKNLTSYVLYNDTTSGTDETNITIPADTLVDDGDKLIVTLQSGLEVNTPSNDFNVTINGDVKKILDNTYDLNFLGVLNAKLTFVFDGVDTLLLYGDYDIYSWGYSAFQIVTVGTSFTGLDLTQDLTITLGQTDSQLVFANADILKND